MWTLRLLGFVVAAEDVTCVYIPNSEHKRCNAFSRLRDSIYVNLLD